MAQKREAGRRRRSVAIPRQVVNRSGPGCGVLGAVEKLTSGKTMTRSAAADKAAIRALDLANRNRPFVQDSAFRRLSKWRSDGFPRDSRSSEYEYGPEPCLADPLERERVGDRRGARIDRAERWRWVAPVGINSSPTELC